MLLATSKVCTKGVSRKILAVKFTQIESRDEVGCCYHLKAMKSSQSTLTVARIQFLALPLVTTGK